MKVLRDTWLVFQREIELVLRSPVALAFSLVQPITYLVIFAPFLKVAMANGGTSSDTAAAYRVYVPGLFVAMGLFGGLFAGYTLLAAVRAGIIDRCRVTPISRTGMLLGRAMKDVATIVLQSVVITIAALPFGLRVGIGYLLLSYLLLGAMAMLSTVISYNIALRVKVENTLGTVVNVLGQPISLLAGVLLPLAMAPLWIRQVAFWNPFAWATDGMRALFSQRLGDPAVWQGITVVTVLMVITVFWTARMFGRNIS